MKRPAIAMLAALWLTPTQAAEVYRCVAKDGAVSWTSDPCPAESRTDRVLSAEIEPGEQKIAGGLMRPAGDSIPEGELACDRGRVVRRKGGSFVVLRDVDPLESTLPCHTRADLEAGER